jgi:hypothetical protein
MTLHNPNENKFQGEIHLYTASMHVNVRIYKIEAVNLVHSLTLSKHCVFGIERMY